MSGSRLVFILSGSIACGKACDALSRLVADGHQVRVVATPTALRFVGTSLLEGLSGAPVLSDMFAPGAALDHIGLTRWADAVVACPATAGLINRLAAGLAGDLPGALFLAHDRTKPWMIVPAMNPAMWNHPATQAAVKTLGGWGVRCLPVARGRTACGEIGEGRMLEPDRIVLEVERMLARPARRLRVLVTSGGTAEPLDAVRVLTNTSTGRTGALIADRLFRAGHEVVLLRAATAAGAAPPIREETFVTFADLDASLGRLLGGEEFDVVIHAAAVGDYGVEALLVDGVPVGRAGKIDSSGSLTVRLRRQPKLVDGLRGRSRNPRLTVVAFKLTAGASPEESRAAARAMFARGVADYIVHNDLSQRDGAPGELPATILAADGAAIPCPGRDALAAGLERLLASLPPATFPA